MELLEFDKSKGYASALIEDEFHEFEFSNDEIARTCELGFYRGREWRPINVEEYADRFGWPELIKEFIEKKHYENRNK